MQSPWRTTPLAAGVLALFLAPPLEAQENGRITGVVTESGSGGPVSEAQVYLPDQALGGLSRANGRYLIINVPPGTYTVRMTVDDGAPLSRDFQVRMNPDLEGVTEADLRERFELAIRIRDRVSEANEAVIRVRDIKARVGERLEETDDEDIKAQAATVGDNLSAVEAEIYQVRNRSNQDPLNYPIRINNKLAALLGLVEGSESRPTHQSYVVFRRLAGLLDEQIEQLETVILRDVGRLNELLVREGLEPIPEGRPAS